MTTRLLFGSDWAPIRHFGDVIGQNPLAVYGDLLPAIAAADYRVFNLESPLCPGPFIAKSGAAFTGKETDGEALAQVHCDAVIMANNHTFDCGDAGFEGTCRVLQNRGIAMVGAGRNLAEARRPHIFRLGGCRIGLFTISEGEDCRGATDSSAGVRPWETELLCHEIREARPQLDVVIVSAHCGLEYQAYPSFYVWEAFEKWAGAGADIIVGHHPHVPQGMCTFGKCRAYFSLGNFVFYQPNRFKYRKTGYMLEISIRDCGISDVRMVPYRIGDDALRLLTESEKTEFLADMDALSAPLKTREEAQKAWYAVLAEYGVAGFSEELARIAGVMKETPGKGAAMLRNRLLCIQHRSQWLDGMERIIGGNIGDAPAEYRAWVHRYLTEELPL